MKNIKRHVVRTVLIGLLLVQAGCLTPNDVRAIAEGQLISFVNALINTATSDAIRSALGT